MAAWADGTLADIMHTNTPIDLSIIIVSWNVRDYLAGCLASLAQQGDPTIEIIVVDSASADGTPDMLRERYPHVVSLPQAENVGFTRGNNIGLAAAQGHHLFLLNPDTEVRGDALARMVAYLEQHPDVGIVGPHTLNTDGTHQSTRRRFPTLWSALAETPAFARLRLPNVRGRYFVRDVSDDQTADIDWVQGSALMLRRSVYEQIGGMDEGYFMFSEEVDLCKRARLAGWRVVYLGEARIVHHGGKSTDQVQTARHIYFYQSQVRYFRKFHGPVVALAARLLLAASHVCSLLSEAAKGALGHKRPMRRARVATYWQTIRNLAGLHN
jgi:hypothetical protein